MRILALSAATLCLFAGSARADLEYQFNGASLGGASFAFSFSIPSATFLADGDTLTFPSFTVNDGVNLWTFTEGAVNTQPGLGCFEFGTASDAVINPCGVGVDGSPPGAAMLLSINGGLPMATGHYILGFSEFTSDPGGVSFLDGTLDITSLSTVPEPTSLGLLGIVLAIVGWILRKRPTRRLCDGRERC